MEKAKKFNKTLKNLFKSKHKPTPKVPVIPEKKMSFEVEALICTGPHGTFTRGKIPRRICNPNDVEIEIHYAGICHSDLHNVNAEWGGQAIYPMVPGHEIAGIVTKTGDKVTKFKIGDKVGVGCMVDSCKNCSSCAEGEEQYCESGMILTYNSSLTDEFVKKKNYPSNNTYGGYSQIIVVDENFVCNVPDALPFEAVAPILCAGITMFSPLKYFGAMSAGSKWKVAIVGLGGLGDMGAKLSKAMGNDVTVISRSEKKRDYVENELRVKFVASGSTDEEINEMVQKHSGEFDFILSTISAEYDVSKYMSLLKKSSTMCVVGAPSKAFTIGATGLIFGRKSLAGSLIGGIAETQEALNFCAEHGIYSRVEQISASEVNYAFTELGLSSASKSRFVIKVKETLTSDPKWTVDPLPAANAPPHQVNAWANIVGFENVAGKTYQPKTKSFI